MAGRAQRRVDALEAAQYPVGDVQLLEHADAPTDVIAEQVRTAVSADELDVVPDFGALADGDSRTLLDDLPQLDAGAAEATVVDAARALCAAWPDTGVVVLECTNMPPYRDAVARACGRPVHDVMTLVHARWAALAARP